ncbi:hypothetical protein AMTR_s00008p00167080, partial [Amborella trichopoda]
GAYHSCGDLGQGVAFPFWNLDPAIRELEPERYLLPPLRESRSLSIGISLPNVKGSRSLTVKDLDPYRWGIMTPQKMGCILNMVGSQSPRNSLNFFSSHLSLTYKLCCLTLCFHFPPFASSLSSLT